MNRPRAQTFFASGWNGRVIADLGEETVFGASRDFSVAIQEEDAFLESLVKQYSLN